jgi:putative hydrolase of the HAD superfamily
MMSRAGRMVDAVIFDFGGVLTLSGPIREELHRYERQLDLPRDTIVQAIGSGPSWEAASTGAMAESDYWAQVAADFAPRLPPAFGRFQHGTLPYEELDPRVAALVREMRGQVKTGLLSNATISLAGYLRRLPGVSGLFDDIVISAEVGLRKPDLEIYRLTVQRLGVEANRAVMIDDKARNTLAAQAAGMYAIVYVSPDQLRQELQRLGLTA